jgi:hypothetical protein
VVVEPALTDPDGSVRRELLQVADIAFGIESISVMRMHSCRKPYEARILVCHNPGCASGAEDIPGAASRADADYPCGSGIPCAIDYLAAVAVERFVAEVRVAVDEPLETPSLRGHLVSIQSNTGLAM